MNTQISRTIEPVLLVLIAVTWLVDMSIRYALELDGMRTMALAGVLVCLLVAVARA